MKYNVAAIVVGYHPEEDILLDLLTSLSSQVQVVVLVDNGDSKNTYNKALKNKLNIQYCELGENKGLGYALNAGFGIAAALGLKYVATFDQDSAPDEHMISALIKAHEELTLSDNTVAAVGPRYFDRREDNKVYAPFYREENGCIKYLNNELDSQKYVQVDMLITSGMLILTEVWISGLKYDESVFIDYTDPEWCFRARSLGYKIFGCLDIEMPHAASNSPPFRIFGLTFFRYSPLRRYYYFRNTLYFCKLWYVSSAWKKRLLGGVLIRIIVNLLIDEDKFKSFTMMMLGLKHGLKNKSGKFTF